MASQSEGWPTSGDSLLELWSDGLNRMQFWQTHARLNTQGCPSLSYIVLKARSDANVHALPASVMAAAAAFVDLPLTGMEELPYTPDALGAVIDELVGGSQGPGHGSFIGWLGKAAGPGAHLVLGKPERVRRLRHKLARLVGLTLSGCTAARDQRPNQQPALRLTPRNPERVGDKWQGGGIRRSCARTPPRSRSPLRISGSPFPTALRTISSCSAPSMETTCPATPGSAGWSGGSVPVGRARRHTRCPLTHR